MQRLSCEVHHIDGITALKQVIESGALGVRLVNDRICFAGPEEYAIRYDQSSGWFDIGFVKLDLYKFRRTPFSFLPSHYWEMYYQGRSGKFLGKSIRRRARTLQYRLIHFMRA
jgi:hypothetical protein